MAAVSIVTIAGQIAIAAEVIATAAEVITIAAMHFQFVADIFMWSAMQFALTEMLLNKSRTPFMYTRATFRNCLLTAVYAFLTGRCIFP